MVTKPQNSAGKNAEITALFCAGIEGDASSYHRFLQTISPFLRSVVSKKLPLQDTEDVVQEILISIHKARHTYDSQRPLMPWLMAITMFRINDALRKAYSGIRRETRDINNYLEIIADVTDSAAADESIDDLLQGVPQRERQILTLMHVDGFTAKEAGIRLGMKESAVKVAAHRAIKKLREKMSR